MQDAVADFKVWYFSKPLATRTYLAACVAVTFLCTLGVLSPALLFYTFDQTFFKFNLWRPITALFYMGKFNFSFIFNIYFAYIAFMKVETQIFSKERYADFLWLLVMLSIGCTIAGSIIDLYFFSNPFLMGLIYVWCKRLPHEEVTFMFGFKVKTGYFPFVYALAMTLFGGSLMPYVIGIMLGHAYIFVKDIAIVRYHKDYLPTPRWFANWWYGRYGEGPVRQPQAGGFFAGQGVRLE